MYSARSFHDFLRFAWENAAVSRVQRVRAIWNDSASIKPQRAGRTDEAPPELPAHISLSTRPGGGFVPFAAELLEDSIASLFERQVLRRPEATAVKDGARRLSYAELNRGANRAAGALVARRMDPAHPVALLFNHKAAMITAMLGVVKAGGWYAPLDPSYPAGRNAATLGEIGAELALTDGESLAIARSYGFEDGQIINLDELEGTAGDLNPSVPTSPTAPACILYTSGSTGRPKGVVLDQRAVLHRAMLYTNDYAIGPDDRLALLQSYVFNAAVREIYAALLNGAGLYIYALKRDGIHHLAGWLAEEGISVLYMVPSTWRVFLDTLQGEKFERLRFVRLGGEAVLARDVAGFQQHFGPGCLLANGLASTETGTICQYFMSHQTRVAGSRVPVGLPVQDKEVSLLDEEDRPVADGTTGELVVASAYLGPGYFAPPGPGAKAPGISNPGAKRVVHTGDLGYRLPDGRIVLVGRKDWQVKLRGQRMNLLEIEQALLALENVAAAAVTLQTGEDGADFLAAYIQPGAQPAPGEDALRQGLRARLPEVMVPAVFLFLDHLPHTAGGKIDRQALPAADRQPGAGGSAAASRSPALPETAIEQALAQIWGEVLGIEEVRRADRFFELGGDSLQASAMMARLEAVFGCRLPLSVLFQHTTLGELAGMITAEDGAGLQGPLVTIQPLGDKTPVFFIPGVGGEVLALRDLVANLGSERPLYGLRMADFGGLGQNPKTIEQAAEQFKRVVQNLRPHGPYILVGYSFGGHLALETARRLAAPGEAQPLVALLDTYPPAPLRRLTPLEKHARFHLSNLRRLKGGMEVAGYFHNLVRRIVLRVVSRRPAWVAAEPPVAPPDSPSVAAARSALSAYRPGPYPGRVVLFKASQRNENFGGDPMERWDRFISGELEIRLVPGDHSTLIKDPQAVELARQLVEILVV
jgi:amino acid adenylation domain-containing protein